MVIVGGAIVIDALMSEGGKGNEDPSCKSHSDCSGETLCGLESFPSTNSKCCLNGTFHEGDFYCKMLENMTCATDEMCQSGACFENVCLDKKLAPGSDAFCDTNGDCTNDICAYSEYDS